MIKEATNLVSCFVSGMSRYRVHPGDDQSISRHVEEALDIIKAMGIEQFFTITVNEDNSMLVNGVRVSLDTPEARKFFVKLRHKGVTMIVISKGVRADELLRLFADLASSSGSFHSYAHIAVKRNDGHPRSELSPVYGLKDNLPRIRRIYHDIATYGSVDTSTVDAVVGSIMANVRKEADICSSLAPVKGDDNDLYAHSLNVAILSIFQGEHLAFGNALLYDVGLAALLHDIGKMLLPSAFLGRQYELNEKEWMMMKNHTVYGAALLASLTKIPEIAMIVAYEHHMRYDGTGYPETRRKARKQNIISQIVAVADFYCALSEDLPHRERLNNASITGLLVKTAGKEFNPLLVDNFVRAMGRPSSDKN